MYASGFSLLFIFSQIYRTVVTGNLLLYCCLFSEPPGTGAQLCNCNDGEIIKQFIIITTLCCSMASDALMSVHGKILVNKVLCVVQWVLKPILPVLVPVGVD